MLLQGNADAKTARCCSLPNSIIMQIAPSFIRMNSTSKRPKHSLSHAVAQRRLFFRQSTLWLTLVFAIALMILMGLRSSLIPHIGTITYRYDGKEVGTGANPLFIASQGKYLFLRFSAFLPIGEPTTFFIKPDDCIESMTINTKAVKEEVAQFCDYTSMGRALDLSDYLKKGENVFVFRLKDTGGMGGMRVTPQYGSPTFSLLNQGALLLAALYVLALLWPLIRRSSSRPLWVIGIGGAILRIFYFVVTPFSLRGHDMKAHLDYITYVAQHWTIPPASDGWEFHQAPLYYFVSAIWMKTGQMLNLADDTISRMLHFESLLFSVGALAIGIWIGTLLFPPKEKTERLLFVGLIASFPSLIYHSVSINNNSLYILLVFLLLALLIRWWQKPSARAWYVLICCLALSFVTRVSALIFLPVLGLSLTFHDKIPWKGKLRLATLSAILFVFLTGWLPLVRFTEANPQNSLTFNSQGMNAKLAVVTDVQTFLTFNPIRVLRSPYANPWNDTPSREYFWEYFFRSAFFGEFSYSEELRSMAVLILACALCLLPLLAYGLYKLTMHYSYLTFPLGLTIIFVTGAHLFYRIYAPFSANQDFRFSLALIPPVLYYLVWSICKGPKSLQQFGMYLAVALASLSAIFVVFLGFFSA